MKLHIQRHQEEAVQEVAGPANAPSNGLSLTIINMHAGNNVQRQESGQEGVLVILSGTCSAEVQGIGHWNDLGEREDVFSGRATALYVPPGEPYTVQAQTDVEIALFRAPADGGGEAFVVRPSDVRCREVGRENWQRTVCDIVDDRYPAQRLVIGETYNQPGAWSSYPPHKHDVHHPPQEIELQEVYHYRLQPSTGFGLQRIYSPERNFDETFTVQDGDTVFIPFGYHPVVAAPGYQLYYLWGLAGKGRTLRPNEDAQHRWVTATGVQGT